MKHNFFDYEFAFACITPSEINQHIARLALYAERCNSIMEFGSGVSSRAFLYSSADFTSIDIDPSDEIKDLFSKSQLHGRNCRLIQADTLTLTITPVDLLFIDTDITFTHLSKELERHHDMVNKYIIVHNTTKHPELMKAILKFTEFHSSEWRLQCNFPNNNGLAVLHRHA